MNAGELLLHKHQYESIKFDVPIKEEIVLLTQYQMAHLFDKFKSTTNEHIKSIFK